METVIHCFSGFFDYWTVKKKSFLSNNSYYPKLLNGSVSKAFHDLKLLSVPCNENIISRKTSIDSQRIRH